MVRHLDLMYGNVDEILQTPYTNVNGIKMYWVAAIDTGGHLLMKYITM